MWVPPGCWHGWRQVPNYSRIVKGSEESLEGNWFEGLETLPSSGHDRTFFKFKQTLRPKISVVDDGHPFASFRLYSIHIYKFERDPLNTTVNVRNHVFCQCSDQVVITTYVVMSATKWVLPRGLFPVGEVEELCRKTCEGNCAEQTPKALASSPWFGISSPQMPHSATVHSGIEPVPWPLPPQVKSCGESDDGDPKNENSVGADGQRTQQSHEIRSKAGTKGKVSQAVFHKISQLYPEHIDDVLHEEQIPTLKFPPAQDPADISQKSVCKGDGVEQERSLLAPNLQVLTTERQEHIERVSVIDVNDPFPEEDHEIRSDNDKISESSVEKLSVPSEALNEKVHPVASLRDLFREDSDFLTPKTSLAGDAESEGRNLKHLQEQANSAEGNRAPEHTKRIFTRNQSSVTKNRISQGNHSTGSVNSDVTGCYINNALAIDIEAHSHPDAFHSRSDLCAVSFGSKESDDEAGPHVSLSSSNASDEHEPKSSGVTSDPKHVLRRPIASRRKRVVDIPMLNQQVLDLSESKRESESVASPKESQPLSSGGSTQQNKKATKKPMCETPKGVIMRGQSHYNQVRGIRRAETGLIMSREELHSTRNRTIPDNPVPKSLRPPVFLEDYEDVPSLTPSSFQKTIRGDSFPESCDMPHEDERRKGKLRSLFALTPIKRDEGAGSSNLRNLFPLTPRKQDEGIRSCDKSIFSITPVKQNEEERSDGRRSLFFLSPARHSEVSGKGFHVDEQGSNSKFSEAGDSSGLIGRLGFGLRRASHALGRKPSSDFAEGARTCTIVIPGSVDEAVCRISVICRSTLDYGVVVRDGGRKIKVQSRGDSQVEYLRATLLIREIQGSEVRCSINIRPSRSNGIKTSPETLWNFYQRLEHEL